MTCHGSFTELTESHKTQYIASASIETTSRQQEVAR